MHEAACLPFPATINGAIVTLLSAESVICNIRPRRSLPSLRYLPNTTALPQRNATSIRMEHCSFPFFLRCTVKIMTFVDQNYAREGDRKQLNRSTRSP